MRFKALAEFIEWIPAAAYTCDPGGLITHFNERAVETWGRAPALNDPRDRWCGSFLLFASDGEPIDHANCWMAKAIKDRKPYEGQEIVIGRPDGSRRTVLAHARPIFDDAGKLVAAVNMLVDVTEAKAARNKLLAAMTAEDAAKREVTALRTALDQHSILSMADARGRIIDINSGFCLISGYTREELLGQDHRLLNSGHHPKAFWVQVWKTISTGKAWRGEVCNRRKDGSLYWVDSTIVPLKDGDGRIEKYVSIRFDITQQKASEERLREAARSDRLTGLPNRTLLLDRIQQAIHRTRRVPGYHFAVLFLDFDRFKTINDSLGHQAGDELLKQIASRLTAELRAGDTVADAGGTGSMAARLGGDEFVILLDGLARPGDACSVAGRLLRALSQPYKLGEHEIFSTASIGVVTSEICGQTAEDVLRDADTAMYEAKAAGKGRWVLFGHAMRQRVLDRLLLENDLRHALSGEQLAINYQPIVCLQTGEMESVEALLRWIHPTRGIVSPVDFIPIAEDTGLILPIGEWVLRTACMQLLDWRKRLGNRAPRTVAVNVSRKQLMVPRFAQSVKTILDEVGLEPAALHVEITESEIMHDTRRGIAALTELREIGVKVDMDDFGTGHSSLACLRQFPIDLLKVDRSFIANMTQGRDLAALVHAVTQLARNMGVGVVAEGIENAEQVAALQAMECDFGQGFYFARPMPAAELESYVTSRAGGPAAGPVESRKAG